IIDECHTVANIKSQRGNLAHLLAQRCESLILTSATPHNGKRENFANLMRMIEPTSIPKYGDFTKEDIEDYFVRRFKKDIHNQVRENFSDREIRIAEAKLHEEEESFLEICRLLREKEKQQDSRNTGNLLFSSLLFKSYLSSPEAAQRTLARRIEKMTDKEGDEDMISELKEAKSLVDKVISGKRNSKFGKLKEIFQEFQWKGKSSDKRMIIFAERIDTLKSLESKIKQEFNLNENVVKRFDGSLTDTEQQELIEDFGKEDSDIRLLLSSDAGSMGVNLHYYCNIMINYDIPWSIITLDQRNGRIDRYGQKETPYIYYTLATSEIEGLQTDLHIIKKIVDKEQEVHETLGDSGTVMKLYDPDKETLRVEDALVKEDESYLESDDFDPLRDILGDDEDKRETPNKGFASSASFFETEFAYYQSLLEYLKGLNAINPKDVSIENGIIEMQYNEDIKPYLFNIPPEATPKKGSNFKLTVDKEVVQKSIENARKKKGQWATFQMLYDLHPIVKIWMNKMMATLKKGTAPVAKIDFLPENTIWYLFHAQVANHLGQSLLSDFFVVALDPHGKLHKNKIYDLKEFIETYQLFNQTYDKYIDDIELDSLQELMPQAIDYAKQLYVIDQQEKLRAKKEEEWRQYKKKLEKWKNESVNQLKLHFEDTEENVFVKKKKEKELADIETIADKTSKYFKDLTQLDNEPFIQVLGAFYNFK
ncbi:MAG: helicase-related protein, partial [bacterium]